MHVQIAARDASPPRQTVRPDAAVCTFGATARFPPNSICYQPVSSGLWQGRQDNVLAAPVSLPRRVGRLKVGGGAFQISGCQETPHQERRQGMMSCRTERSDVRHLYSTRGKISRQRRARSHNDSVFTPLRLDHSPALGVQARTVVRAERMSCHKEWRLARWITRDDRGFWTGRPESWGAQSRWSLDIRACIFSAAML